MRDRPNLNPICSATMTQPHFLLCCLFVCAYVHWYVCLWQSLGALSVDYDTSLAVAQLPQLNT